MGKRPKSVKITPGQVSSSPEFVGIRDTALQDLSRQSAGKGPSIAAEQLKAAQEKTLAQQLAAAQARPSRNVGAAQRQLVQAQGESGRQLAQVGALARAQEQLGARDQLLGLTETDLNRKAQIAQQNAALQAQRQSSIAQSQNQLIGGLLGAAGNIGASFLPSDQKVKENIQPASKEIKSFLDALEARRYNYQEKIDNSKSKNYGVMAQDLEKSEVGKSLVKESSGVKMVDTTKGFGAVLAAQAELNKRLNKLESKGKKS